MDFPDGSTYTINSKALALVSEEENGAANAASEHRHAQKRAKAQASSKEKEDAADLKSPKKRAAPWGANTNEAAKKKKTSASACEVRSEGIPPEERRKHRLPTFTARFTTSYVVTHVSNRRHRQGEGLRSIRGLTHIEESGSRKSR